MKPKYRPIHHSEISQESRQVGPDWRYTSQAWGESSDVDAGSQGNSARGGTLALFSKNRSRPANRGVWLTLVALMVALALAGAIVIRVGKLIWASDGESSRTALVGSLLKKTAATPFDGGWVN